MPDPTFPLFPIFAFIGFVVSLIPLPWHLHAWNAGTCLYMCWTALACLNLFVNSILFHNTAVNLAPVWCDISSRIIIGTAVAIPAASLCINRRLYKIASATTFGITRAEKLRAVFEDLLIGLGIPFMQMALQYIVSGHRFDIIEDIGCFPFTYNVWPAYVLVYTWPVILGLISLVYCVLTLIALSKKRAQLNEMMATNSSLTLNRYLRLMVLATLELSCTTPFAVYSLYTNLTANPLFPYRGWYDTHFNYSHVNQIPAILWRNNHRAATSLELTRWLVVVCALLFFMFFGFAEEARRHYAIAFRALASCVPLGIRSRFARLFNRASRDPPKQFMLRSGGVLPVFVPKIPSYTHSGHDSVVPLNRPISFPTSSRTASTLVG